MSEIKAVRGILPICASCKTALTGGWNRVETCVEHYSDAKSGSANRECFADATVDVLK